MKTYTKDIERYQRRRELQDMADDHYREMDRKRSPGIWIAGICFVCILILIAVAVVTK